MSIIVLINIIIVNIAVWLGLSYFWSYWTHKTFKPWGWLEQHKRKQLHTEVEKSERKYKDRVRYYTYFFAMQQVEQQEVEGEFVLLGLEEPELIRLLRKQCPQRTIHAAGVMEPTNYTIVRENCQGEVSEEVVPIDYASETVVRSILPSTDTKNKVYKCMPSKMLGELSQPIALVLIDMVDYEEVLLSMKKCYELMSRGAIMIVHSYNHDWDGVRKAVDEFAATTSEGFVPVADMYGSVMMIKS